MTTLHDDPFNKQQIRKEADEDRRAAQTRLQAQEEARKRSARRHLEDEKLRLTRERDDKKKKLEEFRREAEEKKREQRESETTARTEHAAEAADEKRPADEREKHLLETRRTHIKTSLASRAVLPKSEESTPDHSALQNVSRKLSTAKAALEKASLEHTQITDEIRQLRRTLEQKETLEGKIRKEKEEAVATVSRLEHEKETTEHDAEASRRANRIAHDATLTAERERRGLEKELLEIEQQLVELDRKEKELAHGKQTHAEAARKAEAERVRTSTALRDLERRIDQLARELSLVEGQLRDIDTKLSKT